MGLVVNFVKDLDAPLLRLSPSDVFTCRDACGGVHVFGGIGSGKTSGSGKMLSGAYLRAGMGGLVTAVKPETIPEWKGYAAQHGRGNSFIVFDENEGFNFLSYLMALQGMAGIGTVVEALMRIVDAARRASATGSHQGGDAFWDDSGRGVLRHVLPPLYSACGSLSIADIIRFISTAPANLTEPTDPAWQKRSFMYAVMDAAARSPKVPMSPAALKNNITYWAEEYPAIPDKTRGNIVITVTAALDRFRHGRLNRVFCGKTTTIVPELSLHGGIIGMCMPTTTWNEDGVIAQQLFKFLWQRMVLSRNNLPEKHRERFVFLWCDEGQETVNPSDGEFLSLCRQSKCCMTYLTQSLPTYFSKIGGDNPKDAALALAGKFMTHIYHSNACPETNEYASRMIGKVVTRRGNYSNGSSQSVNLGMTAGNSENSGYSSNYGSSASSSSGQGNHSSNSGSGHNSGAGSNWGASRGRGTSENVSRGYSESIEYAIEPGDFGRRLQTGGPQNGNEVTGIWFQGGRVFRASGTNWLLARFRQ